MEPNPISLLLFALPFVFYPASVVHAKPFMKNATEQICTPSHLSTRIGGLFGKSFEVVLAGSELTYTAYDPGRVVSERSTTRPSAAQWCEFRRLLDQIDLWNWQAEYVNGAVMDGTQWALELSYLDHSIKAWGSNNYPDTDGTPGTQIEPTETFSRYLRAISALVGNKEFR